ncbi:ComEC/Rec2 family competence protein [soil metagenome]
MTTTGAAVLLACAWAGALVGLRVAVPVPLAAGLTAAAVLLVLAVAGRAARAARAGRRGVGRGEGGERSRGATATSLALLLCAPVALTALTGAVVRTEAVDRGPLRTLAETPTAVDVRLVAVGDARDPPRGRRWLIARVQTVAAAGQPAVRSRERVLLRLPDEAEVAFGGTYTLRGRASALRPGPAAGYFRSIGITVEVAAVDLVLQRPPPAWQVRTTAVRERLAEAAHTRLAIPSASLLTGLVTGDLRGQPDEIADAVLASGLSHLTAVSGSSVALLAAGVMGLALLLRLGRRTGWWACLAAIWWFAVLVRLQPSVVRASVMASLVLGALLVGRVRSTPGLLCTAGLLALLADPGLAGRLGFALSMAATAGVVLAAPPAAAWLGRHTPLPAGVRMALAATCGAQIAVTPILVGVGGAVHLASVPANVVAVPAAVVAKVIGGVAALVAVVSPDLAGLVAALAGPPLRLILWSAAAFASPGGQRAVEVTAAWLAVLVLAGAWSRLPGRARRVAPVAAVALVAAVAGLPGGGGTVGPAAPVLEVLDVGQGDALLLGDPEAGWILVDGGPDPQRLGRVLDQRGVGALATVVVSHPHTDHTGGLAQVISDREVGVVVIGPHGEQAAEVLAAAAAAGAAVVTVAEGDGWRHGAMHLTVLSPPPTGLGADLNENSLVVRVDIAGGRSVLLTGDAEVIAQHLLIGDVRVDVDVLKVPHHGGNTNAPDFLAATSPSVAVISAGADNPFGHPHPDVLADLAGVPVLRTDLDGTISIPLTEFPPSEFPLTEPR